MQNLSRLHEATEDADSSNDPDFVCVAGGVAKIKIAYNLCLPYGAYNLVLLVGIPLVCIAYACYRVTPPLAVMADQKIGLVFMYIDYCELHDLLIFTIGSLILNVCSSLSLSPSLSLSLCLF